MATTLLTQEFPPAPGGMNVALPQQELDDTEARIIQDGLVDFPGFCRRRGPITPVGGLAALTYPASGFAITLNPLGADRYAVLQGDNANGFFSVYTPDFSVLNNLAWPHPLPTTPSSGPATAYRLVDIKPALNGGTMIGVSSAYDANSPNQGIAYWRGGVNANGSIGSISVARGSVNVTGTGFNASLSPGMWIFGSTDEGYGAGTLLGCVLSVNSDVSVTLTSASLYAVSAKAATAQAIRGLYPMVTTGLITCDTSSATINGGNTKFASQGLGSGVWQIYRTSDLAFIGKVSSVASETSLTLTANAALAVADTAYTAVRVDSDYSIANTANVNKVGFLNAVYAQRQFYANLGAQYSKTSTVWFSDDINPEALDVTKDGNSLDIISTSMINEPIRALIPAYNSLVILKENEAFGLFGSSPTSFSVRKIFDDGTLSTMSVQPYGGGALWAGREGIIYYDGINTTNITQAKLGDFWKNSILSFNPNQYRMWSMVARDHYILSIESLTPTLPIVKGNVSTTPNKWVVVINMNTKAVTLMTNLTIRGAITLPASSGKSVWFMVNDGTRGRICDTAALFDTEGNDPFGCDGGTAGPDFYFESKKFDAGQSLRLKRFKQLALQYLAQGGPITIDTVLGLNNIGSTLTSNFPASVLTWDALKNSITTWDNVRAQFSTWSSIILGVLVPKRVRFLKRSQHFSFRLYQSSSAVTRIKIGPYEIGFKMMRPGRVS